MHRDRKQELLPETSPSNLCSENNELRKRKPKLRKVLGSLAIGLAALYGGGDLAWHHFNESGRYVSFPAKCSYPPPTGFVDVVTWNTKQMSAHDTKKLRKLEKLEDEVQPYIVNLQEVTYPAAKKIAQVLNKECISVVYAKADTVQHGNIGDLGNAILVRERPEQIETHSLPGTSYNDTIWRFVKSSWHGIKSKISGHEDPWWQTDTAWQERRAVESIKIKVMVDGRPEYITDTNTHLTSAKDDRSLHNQQLHNTIQFVDKTTADNTTVIYSGDLNSTNQFVNPFLEQSGFTPLIAGSTSPTGGTIDHIAYRNGVGLTSPKLSNCQTYVLKQFASDHFAEEAICALNSNSSNTVT